VKLISRSSAAKALSLAAVSALVLSGCAAAPEEETTDAAAVDFLACAISDEGSWEDKSFNQATQSGMNRAADELGVSIELLRSVSTDDFEPNLQTSVDSGCDVIIGVGYKINDAIKKIGEANPDVSFVLIDSDPGVANVKPLNYDVAQAAFLAGYAAADYSTSKVISTYGGIPIPPVTGFMTGYYYGAMQWGLDNNASVKVVGWNPVTEEGDFMGDFTANSAVSKQFAMSHLDQGADVIMPVAGNQFTAVTTSIEEINPKAVMIGVDTDVSADNPDLAKYVLTSVEKRMALNVFDIISSLLKGEAFDSSSYMGTLENKGVAISPFYDFKISAGLMDKLADLEAGIIGGTYKPQG
jgi:basic membrane protein A